MARDAIPQYQTVIPQYQDCNTSINNIKLQYQDQSTACNISSPLWNSKHSRWNWLRCHILLFLRPFLFNKHDKDQILTSMQKELLLGDDSILKCKCIYRFYWCCLQIQISLQLESKAFQRYSCSSIALTEPYAKEAFVHCHKLCIDTNLWKLCKLWCSSALISLMLFVNTELSSAWKQSLTKLFLPFDKTHRASIMLLCIFLKKTLKHWYKYFLQHVNSHRMQCQQWELIISLSCNALSSWNYTNNKIVPTCLL